MHLHVLTAERTPKTCIMVCRMRMYCPFLLKWLNPCHVPCSGAKDLTLLKLQLWMCWPCGHKETARQHSTQVVKNPTTSTQLLQLIHQRTEAQLVFLSLLQGWQDWLGWCRGQCYVFSIHQDFLNPNMSRLQQENAATAWPAALWSLLQWLSLGPAAAEQRVGWKWTLHTRPGLQQRKSSRAADTKILSQAKLFQDSDHLAFTCSSRHFCAKRGPEQLLPEISLLTANHIIFLHSMLLRAWHPFRFQARQTGTVGPLVH